MTFQPLRSPVDHAIIAGRRTPGIAEIVNADSPRRWDERRGFGLSGATLVYRGAGLARPTLILRLYTDQDWEDWHAFAPIVTRELPPDAAEIRRRERSAETARQQRDALLATQLSTNIDSADPALQPRLRRLDRRANQPIGTALRRPRALDIWHPILEDLQIRSVVVENVSQPKQTADGEWTIEIKLIEFRAPVFAMARPEGSQPNPPESERQRQIRLQSAENERLAAANQALRDRTGS